MRYFLLLILIFGCGTVAWGQTWSVVRDMAPVEAQDSDYGINMVFAGEYLVVSWPKTYVQNGQPDACGEVITYQKNAAEYEEVARLTATDLVGACVNGDGFGYGLAYDHGRLAIGMPAGARAGSNLPGGGTDADSRVFITSFRDGNWQLEETLTADDLGNGKGMGFQLVMEGDVLLVHAHEYDSIFGFAFPISTGVYVFENTGSGFTQTQKLTESFHLFGQDFDYEHGQIIVGAWGEQMIGAPGRIYVYEKNADSWQNVQTINDNRNRNMGNQIEIYQNTLAAGAVNAGGVGAVVVFERDGSGTWNEVQFIEAADAANNDQFGLTVRLDDNELLVGATAGTDQVQTLGAVYHFTKNAEGQYIEQQKIESLKQNEAADQMGANLIFNDTDLLINEPSGRNLDGSITNFWHYNRAGTVSNDAVVNQSTSGVWEVSGLSGQTVNLEVLDSGRALMYVNYMHDGVGRWLFSVGEVNGNMINFGQLVSNDGPSFGAAFDSNDLNYYVRGTAVFELQACEQGSLMIDVTDVGTQELSLQQVAGITGIECGPQTKILANGLSGSWYEPARKGEGFSIYTIGDADQTAIIYWYTYDQQGNPVFYSGQGPVAGSRVEINALMRYSGGGFFQGAASPQTAGSMVVEWNGCAVADLNYDLSAIGLGSGSYTLTQLTRIKETDCQ